MQKKIIALAIAAAFSAPAFADTTVYGVADAAVISRSDTNLKSDMIVISGGLASSRLGVKSVQDAGDLKVVAVAEYALDIATAGGKATPGACTATVTGAAPAAVGVPATATCSAAAGSNGSGIGAARQQMVALAGGFGTVAAGYLQTTGYDWAVKFDPTAGSQVSPLQDVKTGSTFLIGSTSLAARAPRALAYISPDLGGVTVAVNYSTSVVVPGVMGNDLGNLLIPSAQTANLKATAMLLSATYAAGPLAAGAVYATAKDSSTGGLTVTDVALGGSYDLGAAKLFATYQTNKLDTPNAKTDSAISVSVVAPVGPGAVAASFAKNDKKSTTADDNTTALTLAYLQGLSKTTTLYVAYNSITTKAATDIKTSIFAVGLNNKF